jgi:thioredoxin-related protein
MIWLPFRLAGAVALTAALLMWSAAGAAELVIFERAGCPYCAQFDREIGPIYQKTDEGKAAPLRRVDIHAPVPPDLGSVTVERITPVFVLVDHGREIGRIRGYPGEDNFWGLLAGMIEDLPKSDGGKVN